MAKLNVTINGKIEKARDMLKEQLEKNHVQAISTKCSGPEEKNETNVCFIIPEEELDKAKLVLTTWSKTQNLVVNFWEE